MILLPFLALGIWVKSLDRLMSVRLTQGGHHGQAPKHLDRKIEAGPQRLTWNQSGADPTVLTLSNHNEVSSPQGKGKEKVLSILVAPESGKL